MQGKSRNTHLLCFFFSTWISVRTATQHRTPDLLKSKVITSPIMLSLFMETIFFSLSESCVGGLSSSFHERQMCTQSKVSLQYCRSAQTIIISMCASLKGLLRLQTLVGVFTASVSSVFLIKQSVLSVFTCDLSTWNHLVLWVQEIILLAVDDLKNSKTTNHLIYKCLCETVHHKPIGLFVKYVC